MKATKVMGTSNTPMPEYGIEEENGKRHFLRYKKRTQQEYPRTRRDNYTEEN